MGRLAVRRRSGYMSPYPLSMFYGAWRASLHFDVPRGQEPATPWILLGGRWRKVPDWAMAIFRPFNRYRETARGERFC